MAKKQHGGKKMDSPQPHKTVVAEQLKPGAPQPIAAVVAPPTVAESPLLKQFFYASLIVMTLFMLIGGYNVGFHTDEMDMNNYTKANVNYYLSGGKDTTYLGYNVGDENKIETILRYYGTAFEYIPVVFNRLTGLDKSPHEFNVRHIFIQLFAGLALLFTGLIARRAGGWLLALCSCWLLFLTPMFLGGSFFNSKDIPFCTGYLATLFFIVKFLEELPKPKWGTVVWLMCSFAFTTATRIGGLMLGFYLIGFVAVYAISSKDGLKGLISNAKDLLLKMVVIVGGGLVLIVVSWPYVLSNPSVHLGETLTVVKKFPMKIPLNFEGVFTDSLNIPNNYLVKFMVITVPVFVLGAVIAGLVVLVTNVKQLNWRIYALLLFASVFPVAYAMYSNVALYSAWRHFMFIYPGLCILGGLALSHVIRKLQKPVLQYVFVGACILAFFHPISWMVRNHPYEYAYFNEISGGYKQAYYEYETDYWKITMKNGLDWLMTHEPIKDTKDSVTIASDMDMFVKYYLKRHYSGAKVRVVLSDVTNRFAVPWKYAVYSKQFLAPNFLEKYFPPNETIYSETINGMPETVVLKDTVRIDLAAKDAFVANNFPLSDSLLSISLSRYPNNVGLFGIASLVKSYVGKNEESIRYGNLCLTVTSTDLNEYNALCGMGVAYANMARFDSSMSKLRQAQALLPENGLAPGLLNRISQLANSPQPTRN